MRLRMRNGRHIHEARFVPWPALDLQFNSSDVS